MKRSYNGIGNPNYKTGRYKDSQGYWHVLMPGYFSSNNDNYVREHIYVFQEKNKCCMLPWGDVHHIDSNKDNNMPWNIQGMMNKAHHRLHMIGNEFGKKIEFDRKCSVCDSTETYIRKDGNPHWYGNKIKGYLCHNCYFKFD